jgi:hypothetical protein
LKVSPGLPDVPAVVLVMVLPKYMSYDHPAEAVFYTITVVYGEFKNSLIIHEENTKKNHKRVVSLYVDKDFPSFT